MVSSTSPEIELILDKMNELSILYLQYLDGADTRMSRESSPSAKSCLISLKP